MSADAVPNDAAAPSGPAAAPASVHGPSVPMILRIKRKRGTEPADALFIEEQLRGAAGGKDEEHHVKRRSSIRLPASPSLERLPDIQAASGSASGPSAPQQSEQPRKPGSPYFRFAETLASSSKADELELRKRIGKLQMLRRLAEVEAEAPSSAKTLEVAAPEEATGSGSAANSTVRRLTAVGSGSRSAAASRSGSASPSAAGSASAAAAGGSYQRRSGSLRRTGSNSSLRRKAAVISDVRQASAGRKAGSIVPGAAAAAAWLEQSKGEAVKRGGKGKARARTRIIDIVVQEEQDEEAALAKKKQRAAEKAARAKAKAEAKQANSVDSLGEVFKNMLVDHLKARNAEVPEDLRDESPAAGLSDDSASETDEDDDYVYDIYYREVPAAMPSRASANGAAEVGLLPSHVAGASELDPDAVDVDNEEEEPETAAVRQHSVALLGIKGVQSIAALNISSLSAADWADLTAEGGFDDDDELAELVDEEMSGSKLGLGAKPGDGFDSWDEGEDEDSNDEDFYRNDYPEQELSEDDEFGLGHEYRRSDEEDEDDW